MNTEFSLEFYELPNGTKPAEEFVLSLAPKMQVKALDSLEILEAKGNLLREPYSKYVRDGVFELRIQFAGDISRVFYFFLKGKKIIATNGFVKTDRKTPENQIELALKYKADYESRQNERFGKTKEKTDGES